MTGGDRSDAARRGQHARRRRLAASDDRTVTLRSPDQLRALRGLRTQRDLAEAAGCSQAWIAHLERGTRETVSLSLALDIAKALGAPVGELFAGTDDEGAWPTY